MYLSDSTDKLRKWKFPEGTIISEGAYLLVWADNDDSDEGGLHTNFRLSGDGERLFLIDRDDRGNRILDFVEFGPQRPDISYGRHPDEVGEFQLMYVTPGRNNKK